MAWWLNKIAGFAAFTGCLALVTSARAEESLPADWLLAQVSENGQHCDKRAEHREAKRALVACGAAGVWEIALEESGPRFVRRYAFSGDVVGFFTEPDGRLWVKLQILEARPFASASTPGAVRFPDTTPGAPLGEPAPSPALPSPALPSPPAPSPAAPAPTAVPRKHGGRVTRTAPGEVVISLGTLDGIGRSDRIELSLEEPGEGDDAALSREAIAVGVVTNVTEHSAKVRLGLNESVPVGALAVLTRSQPTGSLSAPPRVTGLWSLELFARPFTALGELGGGALLSGAVGGRFGNLHVQAVVDPFAVADVQDKSSVMAANAALIASYDSQYFEMGLGFGAQTVNESGFFLDPGSGIAAAQLIRLGSQDGLNISARTSIVLFHSEFEFGGMVASGQIPVTRGYWLLLNGGGGNVGYGFGEFGLRVLLTGNGLAGSKFLTVSAGGAAVFKTGACDEFFFCQESVSYGGPMAGIGGEWRF